MGGANWLLTNVMELQKVFFDNEGAVVCADQTERFKLAAVIEDPADPQVFTVVAYRPDDRDLLASQFPGLETRMLGRDVLHERAQAEVRALLQFGNNGGKRATVVIGTTDGRCGWAAWNLRFLAPRPEPAPGLPGVATCS